MNAAKPRASVLGWLTLLGATLLVGSIRAQEEVPIPPPAPPPAPVQPPMTPTPTVAVPSGPTTTPPLPWPANSTETPVVLVPAPSGPVVEQPRPVEGSGHVVSGKPQGLAPLPTRSSEQRAAVPAAPEPQIPPPLRLLGPYRKAAPISGRYQEPLLPMEPRAPLPVTPLKTVQPAGPLTALEVEVIGPPTAGGSQPLEYGIMVRNRGSTPSTPLAILAQLSEGSKVLECEPAAINAGPLVLWSLDRLVAGQEQRFKLRVQPGPGQEVEVVASALVLTSSTSRRTTLEVTAPLVKITGPETVRVGQKIPLQILLRNPGHREMANLLLKVSLPAGLQHVAGKEIEADLGAIAPGKTRTIEMEVTAVQAGKWTADVVVQTATGEKTPASFQVQVKEAPALVLKKTGAQRPRKGSEVEYRLEVINSSRTEVQDVVLRDVLPVGLGFVSASERGVFDPGARSVQWNLGTLGPGQSHTVTVRLRPLQTGEQVNQVAVQAAQTPEVHLTATLFVEDGPPEPVLFPGARLR